MPPPAKGYYLCPFTLHVHFFFLGAIRGSFKFTHSCIMGVSVSEAVRRSGTIGAIPLGASALCFVIISVRILPQKVADDVASRITRCHPCTMVEAIYWGQMRAGQENYDQTYISCIHSISQIEHLLLNFLPMHSRFLRCENYSCSRTNDHPF